MLTLIFLFQKCQTSETAKKLKDLNVEIDIIIKSTGLTKEEIERL